MEKFFTLYIIKKVSFYAVKKFLEIRIYFLFQPISSFVDWKKKNGPHFFQALFLFNSYSIPSIGLVNSWSISGLSGE